LQQIKNKKAAQNFIPGGISYGYPQGEPEQITIRSQWQNVEGGEYIVKSNTSGSLNDMEGPMFKFFRD